MSERAWQRDAFAAAAMGSSSGSVWTNVMHAGLVCVSGCCCGWRPGKVAEAMHGADSDEAYATGLVLQVAGGCDRGRRPIRYFRDQD